MIGIETYSTITKAFPAMVMVKEQEDRWFRQTMIVNLVMKVMMIMIIMIVIMIMMVKIRKRVNWICITDRTNGHRDPAPRQWMVINITVNVGIVMKKMMIKIMKVMLNIFIRFIRFIFIIFIFIFLRLTL